MATYTKNHKKSLSNKEIVRIREVAKHHEQDILAMLGFEINRRGVQQNCPIHGGDNSTAFSYNLSKHCWSCFTNHCDKEFGNDLIGLIRGMKNLNFADTITWISDTFIKGNNEIEWSKIDQTIADQQAKDIHWNQYNKTIDQNKIKSLIQDYSSIQDRNYAPGIPEFFEAGVSLNEGEQHHRLMIPIRNFKNNLTGFTGRSIYKQCDKCDAYHKESSKCPEAPYEYSKWRHYPPFFKKNIELYNIYNAKEHIYKTNTAILVEGPFDVWRLWEYGVFNVVAGFGTTVSHDQTSLLAMHGCLNLNIMYDSDEAGQKAAKNALYATREIFRSKIVKLPDGTDPGSLTKEQYEEMKKDLV